MIGNLINWLFCVHIWEPFSKKQLTYVNSKEYKEWIILRCTKCGNLKKWGWLW